VPVAGIFVLGEGGGLGLELVCSSVFLCIFSLTHPHIWLIAFSFSLLLLLQFSHAGGEEVLVDTAVFFRISRIARRVLCPAGSIRFKSIQYRGDECEFGDTDMGLACHVWP